MKKLSLFAVLMLLAGATALRAQNLYFCDNFSDAGEPLGITNSKSFDAKGGYVYFLYQNGKKNIKSKVLLISVAIQKNNEYSQYDTKVFENLKDNQNWAVYDYNFKEAGNYRVTVLDGDKKELAKGFISVTIKDTKEDHDYVNDDTDEEVENFDPVDDDYYNAEMTFTTDVKDGKPVDDSELFTITSAGGYIYIYVMNDNPLNSTGINLIIHKMNEETYRYDEELTNEPYTINGTIPGTYIKYTFYEAGKYKVQVTNKDDVPIASGYVTIEMSQD